MIKKGDILLIAFAVVVFIGCYLIWMKTPNAGYQYQYSAQVELARQYLIIHYYELSPEDIEAGMEYYGLTLKEINPGQALNDYIKQTENSK